MRTVFVLAVGIWIGRQIYLKHDKVKIEKRERAIKTRLESHLKGNGMRASDVRKTVKSIINQS